MQHVRDAKSEARRAQRTECRAINNAIRKYGTEAFVHEVLDVVTTQEGADIAEARWIEQRRSRSPVGYNLNAGGGGRGKVHDDTRRTISEKQKARWASRTPEQRLAHMQPALAAVSSEERSARIRAMHAKHTPEERSEMGRQRMAKLSPERRVEMATAASWSRFGGHPPATKPPREPKDQSAAAKKREEKLVGSGRRAEMSRAIWSSMSPEQREDVRARIHASQLAHSPEERSAVAKAAQAKLTPEERSDRVRRGWETRRKRRPS
jgi:hypothetical protein